eukprot:Skav230280  [mRNA]  locus=scaffold2091:128976:133175:+ [translate_table: standard]
MAWHQSLFPLQLGGAEAPNKQYAPEWKIAKIFMADTWEEPRLEILLGKKSAMSQLYKPEVKMIKRLVGHELIQQNRLMWDEISSLRQMLAEFRDQNDELCKGRRQHADLCDTQHRELLKRQAHLLLNDLRAKASGCGHALEDRPSLDMVPEFRGSEIYRYLIKEDQHRTWLGPMYS